MPHKLAFARGRRNWRIGRPAPIIDPDGWVEDDTHAEWLGWMFARGVDYLRRRAIAERINGPDAADRVEVDP